MKTLHYLPEWRAKVRSALSERGRKAELARHLDGLYGGGAQSWQVRIHNILGRQIPAGEVLLAVNAWLATHK